MWPTCAISDCGIIQLSFMALIIDMYQHLSEYQHIHSGSANETENCLLNLAHHSDISILLRAYSPSADLSILFDSMVMHLPQRTRCFLIL
jgi:hypothetical protein